MMTDQPTPTSSLGEARDTLTCAQCGLPEDGECVHYYAPNGRRYREVERTRHQRHGDDRCVEHGHDFDLEYPDRRALRAAWHEFEKNADRSGPAFQSGSQYDAMIATRNTARDDARTEIERLTRKLARAEVIREVEALAGELYDTGDIAAFFRHLRVLSQGGEGGA